jgi:hypothetical protein
MSATFSASLALPRVAGLEDEAAAKHAHVVRQGRVMGLIALDCVLYEW